MKGGVGSRWWRVARSTSWSLFTLRLSGFLFIEVRSDLKDHARSPSSRLTSSLFLFLGSVGPFPFALLIVAALRRAALQIFPNDLPAEIDKHLVNIGSPAGRGLVVGGIAPALREGKCASTRHRTVLFEIRLVSYNHNGNFLVVLDANDLFS